MAKWTDYTTDTEPTDNDEVMTLDTDKSPKANKRVTLSTLADYFLDKLASKVFAKLETQNQTVIGALNELNSKALMHNKVYSANYDTSNLETIEIDLEGTANNAVEILLIDKVRMIFVHAYSADGKIIREIVTKKIYGDDVEPVTNNAIISIHVGSWVSGTVIMSYTRKLPLFSIK